MSQKNFPDKLIEDFISLNTNKEYSRSNFIFLNEAIQDLINSGQEGNLCIQLIKEEELKDSSDNIRYKKLIKELELLPKDTFIIEDNHLYFQKTWQIKKEIENSFNTLLQWTKNHRKLYPNQYHEETILSYIEELEICRRQLKGQETFKLKPEQKVAILESIRSPFHIITGGPGTGKTTVIAFILEILNKLNELPIIDEIALAAPTGRAGMRLTTSIQENLDSIKSSILYHSKLKGTTIHRLLRYQIYNHKYYFNQCRSIPHCLVLIDEVSMIDIYLFHSLLQALPSIYSHTEIQESSNFSTLPIRFILIGDPNQLPSVEKGNVLGDILNIMESELIKNNKSNSIFISRLTESNRHSSKEGRQILALAESILKGESKIELNNFWKEFPRTKNEKEELQNDYQIRNLSVIYLWEQVFRPQLTNILEKNLGKIYERYSNSGYLPDNNTFISWTTEIKCLTIYRRGNFGIEGLQKLINEQINIFFRESENFHIPRIIISNKLYYPGLPIIITKNDSTRNLYNGDVGYVLLIDNELRAFFLIDGLIFNFALDTLPEHEEAYFLTVHKSQGSEYNNLYIYIPPIPSEDKIVNGSEINQTLLFNRQILYTGITRAKNKLEIFGSREGFIHGMNNIHSRVTGFNLIL